MVTISKSHAAALGERVFLLSCAAMILGACSTTEDVASLMPVRNESFAKAVDVLSTCVLSDLSAQERGYAFRRIVAGHTVTIEAQIAISADTPGEFVQFQVEFAPSAAGGTLVIARSKKTIWGNPVYPDTVWPTIRQCAN